MRSLSLILKVISLKRAVPLNSTVRASTEIIGLENRPQRYCFIFHDTRLLEYGKGCFIEQQADFLNFLFGMFLERNGWWK
jgi:hypothetical protein